MSVGLTATFTVWRWARGCTPAMDCIGWPAVRLPGETLGAATGELLAAVTDGADPTAEPVAGACGPGAAGAQAQRPTPTSTKTLSNRTAVMTAPGSQRL